MPQLVQQNLPSVVMGATKLHRAHSSYDPVSTGCVPVAEMVKSVPLYRVVHRWGGCDPRRAITSPLARCRV